MVYVSTDRASCAVVLAAFAICAAYCWPERALAAQAGDPAGQASDPAVGTSPRGSLPQVTVTAQERRRLDNVLIPRFIHSHGTLTYQTNQLARWRAGLCPISLGLPPAYNTFVSRRLREVAASVGAPVDTRPNCRFNVRVLFVTQPQAQLDAIARKAPDYLGSYFRPQAKRFETFSHIIQSWYTTATRSGDGREWVDSVYGKGPGGASNSRLDSGLSSSIVRVLVIVDSNKVVGYSIGSVSDYIAMLVLAQAASLDNCDELPSITDLMASNCDNRQKAEALTAADIAYLKGLYSADMSVTTSLELSHIHTRMLRELDHSAQE